MPNSKEKSLNPSSHNGPKSFRNYGDKIDGLGNQLDKEFQNLMTLMETLPRKGIWRNAEEFRKLQELTSKGKIEIGHARQTLLKNLEDFKKSDNLPENIKSAIDDAIKNVNTFNLGKISSICKSLFNIQGFNFGKWAHENLKEIFENFSQLYVEIKKYAGWVLEAIAKPQTIDEEEKSRLDDFLRSNELNILSENKIKKIEAIESAFSMEMFVKNGSHKSALGPFIYHLISILERSFLSDLREGEFLTGDDSVNYTIFNRAYRLFPEYHFYDLGYATCEYKQDAIHHLDLFYNAIFRSLSRDDLYNLLPSIQPLAKRLKGINNADKISFLKETLSLDDPGNNLELILWPDDLLKSRLTELHQFSVEEELNLPDPCSDKLEDSDVHLEQPVPEIKQVKSIRHTLLPGVLEFLLQDASEKIRYDHVSGINLLKLAEDVLQEQRNNPRPPNTTGWSFDTKTDTGLETWIREAHLIVEKIDSIRISSNTKYSNNSNKNTYKVYPNTIGHHCEELTTLIEYSKWCDNRITKETDSEIIDLFFKKIINKLKPSSKQSKPSKDDPKIKILKKLKEDIKKDISQSNQPNSLLDVDRNCLPINTDAVLNLIFSDPIENVRKVDTDLLYLIDHREHDEYKKLAHYLLINPENTLSEAFHEIETICREHDKRCETSEYFKGVPGFGMGARDETIQKIKTLLVANESPKNNAELKTQHEFDTQFIPKNMRISFEDLCKRIKNMRDQAETLKKKYQDPEFLNKLKTENTLQNNENEIELKSENRRDKNYDFWRHPFWVWFFCDNVNEAQKLLPSQEPLLSKEPVITQQPK